MPQQQDVGTWQKLTAARAQAEDLPEPTPPAPPADLWWSSVSLEVCLLWWWCSCEHSVVSCAWALSLIKATRSYPLQAEAQMHGLCWPRCRREAQRTPTRHVTTLMHERDEHESCAASARQPSKRQGASPPMCARHSQASRFQPQSRGAAPQTWWLVAWGRFELGAGLCLGELWLLLDHF